MLPPGTRIDRYVVEKELGHGATAVVYRIRHEELGVHYALKLLVVAGAALQQRLLQEGRLQARIQHPNVVRVLDVLSVHGHPALVEEYVDGPTLERFVAIRSPPQAERLRLFRQVVEGVAAAHALGIIHRDLKPANVLVEERNGVTVARVSDFGIARAFSEDSAASLTQSGVAMGTPAYMAPEQGKDARKVDHRADIFALGCILYELVCNQMCFPIGDVTGCLESVAMGAYVPPEEVDPDIPVRLCRLIRACLALNPDDRPPNCAAVLEALGNGEAGPDKELIPHPPTLQEIPSTARIPTPAAIRSPGSWPNAAWPAGSPEAVSPATASPTIVAEGQSGEELALDPDLPASGPLTRPEFPRSASSPRPAQASPPRPARYSPTVVSPPPSSQRVPSLPSAQRVPSSPSSQRVSSSPNAPLPPRASNTYVPPAVTAPRRTPLVVWLLMGLGVGVGVLGLLGAAMLLGRFYWTPEANGPSTPELPAAVETVPDVVTPTNPPVPPAPIEEHHDTPPVVTEPHKVTTAPVKSSDSPPPVVVLNTRPVTPPDPDPQPATSTGSGKARVVLNGALPLAWLSKGERKVGLVAPAGDYHLFVQFQNGEAQDVGAIHLDAGQTLQVYCNEVLSSCKLSP